MVLEFFPGDLSYLEHKYIFRVIGLYLFPTAEASFILLLCFLSIAF